MLEASEINIITRQISKRGPETLIQVGPILLTDILMNNTGKGRASLIVTDGEHTHVIAVLDGPGNINHSFASGWIFWKEGSLVLVKEKDNDGDVHVAIGWSRTHRPMTYDQWTRNM